MQQWTNFCTNFSPKKRGEWGTCPPCRKKWGDAVPPRPRPTTPLDRRRAIASTALAIRVARVKMRSHNSDTSVCDAISLQCTLITNLGGRRLSHGYLPKRQSKKPTLTKTKSFSHIQNTAVIDGRLRPRCCHLWSYFKHTPFSCRYVSLRRNIMCKHYVMNIQHAYCGLVGPDCDAREVGP